MSGGPSLARAIEDCLRKSPFPLKSRELFERIDIAENQKQVANRLFSLKEAGVVRHTPEGYELIEAQDAPEDGAAPEPGAGREAARSAIEPRADHARPSTPEDTGRPQSGPAARECFREGKRPESGARITRFEPQQDLCEALWCRRRAGFRTHAPEGAEHSVCLDHAHEFCRMMGIGLHPSEGG